MNSDKMKKYILAKYFAQMCFYEKDCSPDSFKTNFLKTHDILQESVYRRVFLREYILLESKYLSDFRASLSNTSNLEKLGNCLAYSFNTRLYDLVELLGLSYDKGEDFQNEYEYKELRSELKDISRKSIYDIFEIDRNYISVCAKNFMKSSVIYNASVKEIYFKKLHIVESFLNELKQDSFEKSLQEVFKSGLLSRIYIRFEKCENDIFENIKCIKFKFPNLETVLRVFHAQDINHLKYKGIETTCTHKCEGEVVFIKNCNFDKRFDDELDHEFDKWEKEVYFLRSILYMRVEVYFNKSDIYYRNIKKIEYNFSKMYRLLKKKFRNNLYNFSYKDFNINSELFSNIDFTIEEKMEFVRQKLFKLMYIKLHASQKLVHANARIKLKKQLAKCLF